MYHNDHQPCTNQVYYNVLYYWLLMESPGGPAAVGAAAPPMAASPAPRKMWVMIRKTWENRRKMMENHRKMLEHVGNMWGNCMNMWENCRQCRICEEHMGKNIGKTMHILIQIITDLGNQTNIGFEVRN